MKIKKAIAMLTMVGMFSTGFVQAQFSFPDVVIDWQKIPVQWAVDREVVQGYPDGTFKPDNQVLESEFATMIVRYASNIEYNKLTPIQQKHWSQHLYNELAKYDLPFKGYNTDEVKNKPVNRGTIAQIIAAKNGFNLTIEQAVEYMYENELSNGKGTVKDFANYGANDFMTRAEATAFMQRLSTKGVTTFRGIPSTVKAEEILGIKNPVFDGTKEQSPAGSKEFHKIAENLASKYGYISLDGKKSVDIRDKDNKTLLTYSTGTLGTEQNYYSNTKYLDMTLEMIQQIQGFSQSEMDLVKKYINQASTKVNDRYEMQFEEVGNKRLQIQGSYNGNLTIMIR